MIKKNYDLCEDAINKYNKDLSYLQKSEHKLNKIKCSDLEESERLIYEYDTIQRDLMSLIEETAQHYPCDEILNSAIMQLAVWSGCSEDIEKGEAFCAKLLSSELITQEQNLLYLNNVNRRQG